jgi:hypothetical protein
MVPVFFGHKDRRWIMRSVCNLFMALIMILTIPGAAFSTDFATITVDGDPTDWFGLEPAFVDSEGDQKCGGEDADLRYIYTAMDNDYAYIMVETSAEALSDTVLFELDFQYDFQNLHTNIFKGGMGAWINGKLHPFTDYAVAWGQVMEAKIALSELGNPLNFDPTKINSWDTTGFSSNMQPCDLTFTTVFNAALVFSQVSEYDQTDFPGLKRSVIMVPAAVFVSNPPSVDQISVSVTGIGNYKMDYQEGWKTFWAIENNPAPGPEWATTYRFESGSDFRVLDLTEATFRVLEVPKFSISGRTVSWNRISTDTQSGNYETYYEVWLIRLDETGYPDHAAGSIFQSGLLQTTSFTLPESIPDGEYAVRVNAREYLERDRELRWWEWFNRSCFYKRISIGDIQGPEEMADALIGTIKALDLPKAVENSYLANLKKVKVFIERGQTNAAINQIKAFLKKVENDISKGRIVTEEGRNLIYKANQLIAALS